ncbi:hypothetical protein CDAR_556591 [Caerostris darwini]|uniref:Uncharacterized protein n=1 Tax=Caerostris darwini TaxID=1538125 RepID=A0AAV4TX58_9ARAC|nr:hypothetical protein CDAR_556591 [Caerostris darwini]
MLDAQQDVLQDGCRGICSAISSPETTERWGFGGNGKAIKSDECEREKLYFNCLMVMDLPEIDLGLKRFEFRCKSKGQNSTENRNQKSAPVTSSTLNIDREPVEVPDNRRILERTIRKGTNFNSPFLPFGTERIRTKRKGIKESRNLHPLMIPCTRNTRTCSRTGVVGSAPQLVLRKLQKDGDLVEMGKQLSRMNARGKRLDFNCAMVVDVPEIGLGLKRFEFRCEV